MFARPTPLRSARRLAIAGAVALLLAPSVGQAQGHFPDDEDLQEMLRYLVEDGETPGIVLGLYEADGSTRVLSYGDSGVEGVPMNEHSVFEMGSITKAFTGILLADMANRGEVSLSDPLSKYMPEGVTIPTWEGREITLLDVTTHRSSLPRMADDMGAAAAYNPYSMDDLHAFVSGHELRREIGSEFEYSNIAIALLGDALARVAGMSYEELLRERILDPLGMDLSSTVVAGDVREWMTQGHDSAQQPAPYRNWPDLPAMGALRSNATDMLTFIAANLTQTDSRLGAAMARAREPHADAGSGRSMGLNWQIATVGGRTIVTHGGGTAGYSTRVAFDPELGVGIVRLANTTSFGDDIGMDILIRGRPLDLPEVDVPNDVLESFAGRYDAGSNRELLVRYESEGHLTLQTRGNVRFRMYAESETEFFLKRTPWRFAFERDESGEVVAVLANIGGQEARALKIDGDLPSSVIYAGNPLDLDLTQQQMATYVGTYQVDVGGNSVQMLVRIEDGQLVGRMRQPTPTRLLYQGDHAFVPAFEASTRIVYIVEDGRATAVEVHQGENVYRGVRAEGG